MNKNWLIALIVIAVYLMGTAGALYYFAVPSLIEKEAVLVSPKPYNSKPISDEMAKQLQERKRYGDFPINVDASRLDKHNLFRFEVKQPIETNE